MSKKACDNCIHSYRAGGKRYCRRFPPGVVPVIGEAPVIENGQQVRLPDGGIATQVATLGHMSIFPEVTDGWVCGEHSGIIRI